MKSDKLTAQGRETMERFKMEAANEVGVNLKSGYNGDITAREAGSVGGMMVKKMIPILTQEYVRETLNTPKVIQYQIHLCIA